MAEYHPAGHSLHDLKYHLVWITKYRFPVLRGDVEEFPVLRKRSWGQQLWARGYFCATVGAVDEDTIKRYIEEQKWDDDGEGQFRIVTGEPRT